MTVIFFVLNVILLSENLMPVKMNLTKISPLLIIAFQEGGDGPFEIVVFYHDGTTLTGSLTKEKIASFSEENSVRVIEIGTRVRNRRKNTERAGSKDRRWDSYVPKHIDDKLIMNEDKYIEIDYTNWRNIRSVRKILPIRIYFAATDFHPEPQWILEAFDPEKKENRAFALKMIHQIL